MRPLELRIEGLNQFREPQQIPFSKLELFAITGPTGAGKTSILDAMTLALYGEVARGITPKELLSLNSQKLQVSLRFLTDGFEYEVTRIWSYRTKTPQTTFQLQKRINHDEWEAVGEQKEADITASIIKIVGMDFETFTKVILLPQGKFDKFLKAESPKDKKRRREILRELAGYQIFEEMRSSAESQANQLKAECFALEQQLNALQIPSIAEIEENRKQYDVLTQQIPILEAAFQKARTTLESEQKLWRRIKNREKLQQQLVQLNQQVSKIEETTQKLNEARIADKISGIWKLLQAAKSQYDKAKAQVEAAQIAFEEAQSLLEQEKIKLKQVKADEEKMLPLLEQRQQALNSAKIYEEQRSQIAADAEKLEEMYAQKQKTLSERNTAVTEAEKDLQEKQKNIENLSKDLENISPGGERLKTLNEIVLLLLQWEAIANQVQTDKEDLEKLNKEIQTVEADTLNAENVLQTTKSELDEAVKKLQEAEAFNNQVEQQNKAAALRELLQTGDSCLVCGGIYPDEHLLPAIQDAQKINIKPLQKTKDKANEKYDEAKTTKVTLEAQLTNLRSNQLKAQENLKPKDEELSNFTQQITTMLMDELWTPEAVKAEQKKLYTSNEKYLAILDSIEKLELAISSKKQTVEFCKERYQDASKELNEAEVNLGNKNTHLDKVKFQIIEILGEDDYETLLQKLNTDKLNLKERVDSMEKKYQLAREEYIKAEEADKKAKQDEESAQNEYEQKDIEWQKTLQGVEFTEVMFTNALASSENQLEWQQQIDNFKQEQVKYETLIKQETDEIGERTTTEETLQLRVAEKEKVDSQLKQVQDDAKNIQILLKNIESNQKQAEQLQSNLSSRQKDEKVYSTLAKDLQGNNFQDYILEHLEHELVSLATVKLWQLTNKRYVLVYQKGDYWVEDHWNGGETRRVKTLSGGEIFATSLSLALALSERLSRGKKLDSLFIDEGFGTLDADTLEVVTQVLESFRGQDKLVGVISHVPIIGERLGTEIKVEKHPEGSLIKIEGLFAF